MVNELRTLLLNEPASPGIPGAEFVDPRFRPRTLGSAPSAVRAALFQDALGPGAAARSYRNFIATLLTRLAYSCDVAAAVRAAGAFDARTYLQPAAVAQPRTSLVQVSAAAFEAFTADASFLTADSTELTIDAVGGETIQNDAFVLSSGGAYTPARPGVFANSWAITALDGTTFSITSTLTGVGAATLPVTFVGDSSLPVPLPGGGGLFLQCTGATALPPGLRAILTASVPMGYDALAALGRLRARPETGALFGLGGDLGASLAPVYTRPGYPQEQLAAVLFAYGLTLLSSQ